MFCMGETICAPRSGIFPGLRQPDAAKPSAEVSLPSSAWRCSASTWPCGVIGRRRGDEIVDHRAVPSFSRTRNATGSPQATLIVSSRTANGRAPSGVM